MNQRRSVISKQWKGGKGDRRRNENHKAYNQNYGRIFEHKESKMSDGFKDLKEMLEGLDADLRKFYKWIKNGFK